MSTVAAGKVESAHESDAHFYRGKMAAARWFCQNVLPGLTLTRKLIEAGNLDLMDLADESF